MNLRLSVGVEIPNGDFAFKSDGAGRLGNPDGWTPTGGLWTTDIGAGTLIASWEPMQLGSGLTDAAPFYGSGRALKVSVDHAIASNVLRVLDSPRSPAGQCFGTEQLNLSQDAKYRLRWLFRGEAPVAPADADFQLVLIAQDEAKTVTKSILTANILGSDFDVAGAGSKGWMWRESALTALSSSGWGGVGPDHLFVRIIAKDYTNGVNGQFASALFGAFVVECLWPAETGYATSAALLQNPFVGFWELSRPPQWKKVKALAYESQAKGDRLPSGRRRTFDPSGGIVKRVFEYGYDFLTATDLEKLWRLWRINKGYSSDSGSRFGYGLPLVLHPGTPDQLSAFAASPVITDPYPPAAYYVDFADDTFPIAGYSGAFQASTASATKYGGVLRFVER